MSHKVSLAAPCGIYCGECELLEKQCAGCMKVQGKPFWVGLYGREVCDLYDCSINRKQLEHCGMCDELPCEVFLSQRDPSMTDEQFEDSLKERQKDLTLRKEMGTEAWLKEHK